jgi:hypothetical protein
MLSNSQGRRIAVVTLTPTEVAALTTEWPQTNARRCDLMSRNVQGLLCLEEVIELRYLQHLAVARIGLLAPLPGMEAIEIHFDVHRSRS